MNNKMNRTLTVYVACDLLTTPADIALGIDGKIASEKTLFAQGPSPCIATFSALATLGPHTLTVKSKRLGAEYHASVTVRAGENWILISPQQNNSGWDFDIQSLAKRPTFS